MAHSVFLSYSQKNKPTADAVCRALEANDVRVWMAPRDVVLGADWAGSITDAIGQARVMVLIVSESANSSKHIAREIGLAARRKLTIIPLRIANAEPGGALAYYLEDSQWFDAFPPPLEPHLTKFVATVRKSLVTRTQDRNRPGNTPKNESVPDPPSLAPAKYKLRHLLAGTGASVALAAVAIFGIYLSGNGEQAPPPNPIPPETDCTKLTPPCSGEADADAPPLPGMEEITGFAKVLSASTLQIKDKRIELADVAPAPANSAQKLKNLIELYGYSVRCRRAPRRGKYFCDVGPSHIDLTTQVLRQGWAKRASGAAAEMPPN